VAQFLPDPASVIAIDRVLTGLQVEVESPILRGPPPPTVQCERSGSAVLELACGASVRLSQDSLTVMPPRRLRVVSNRWAPHLDAHQAPPAPATAGLRIRATYQGSVNLFDELGEPLVEHLVPDDPLRRCFEELLDEIAVLRPGRCAMAETLFRRMLIMLLRRCFERQGRLAWMAGLEDTRLGRAVAAMREHPAHAFTLTELADVAGMSRTVFAARFANALAQPPIVFLKKLRLSRAADLLVRTDLPVKAIAAQVGYASRSSFTRAFVACHGAAPKVFRAGVSGPAVRLHGPGPASRDAGLLRPR
jgi:AraC-like DNA-binding protein